MRLVRARNVLVVIEKLCNAPCGGFNVIGGEYIRDHSEHVGSGLDECVTYLRGNAAYRAYGNIHFFFGFTQELKIGDGRVWFGA